MRYLNALYVTEHRARVSRSKGALIVSTDGARRRVPLEAIDSVTLMGGAQMTTDAIAACAERSIRVTCMRRSGAIRFIVSGPQGGNVHLRVAQHRASASPEHSLEIAKGIVAAKLQSSRRVVMRWRRDQPSLVGRMLEARADLLGDRLARVPAVRDADQLRGLEGDGARAYFAAMGMLLADTPFPFTERNRRPPRDPVNALLGFAYGLMVSEIVGAAEAVGLDPQVGFLHRPRSGRPSLALDLAEELRSVVDRVIVRLLRRRQLDLDDFVRTPGGAVYLSDDGRRRFFQLWEAAKTDALPHVLLDRYVERWALPSIQATLLARHLRGDLAMYAPFVITG